MKGIKEFWYVIRIGLKILIVIGACPLIAIDVPAWLVVVYCVGVGGLLGMLEILAREWE